MKPVDNLARMMKDLVALGASKATYPDVLIGKFYLMMPGEAKGDNVVIWRGEVSKEDAFEQLLRDLLIEELQEDFFKVVNLLTM